MVSIPQRPNMIIIIGTLVFLGIIAFSVYSVYSTHIQTTRSEETMMNRLLQTEARALIRQIQQRIEVQPTSDLEYIPSINPEISHMIDVRDLGYCLPMESALSQLWRCRSVEITVEPLHYPTSFTEPDAPPPYHTYTVDYQYPVPTASPPQSDEPCASATKIMLNGIARDVLVQSIGQNCPELAKVKNISELPNNTLIISDANTGELLWSGGTHKYASKMLTKMQHNIAGGINVVDLNRDGFGEQLIFVDTGGQVWRLFLDQEQSKQGQAPVIIPLGSSHNGGVMATLSGSSTSNRRSFYQRPVVGITTDGTKNYLLIGIGSGSKVLPQGGSVQDRFYALKSDIIADNRDNFTPITELDLANKTPGIISISDGKKSTDSAKEQNGWYLDLPGQGEKILSEATLTNGYFGFVSYQPPEDKNKPKGTSRIYTIKARTGETKKRETLKEGDLNTSAMVEARKRTPVLSLCAGTECSPLSEDSVQIISWVDSTTH